MIQARGDNSQLLLHLCRGEVAAIGRIAPRSCRSLRRGVAVQLPDDLEAFSDAALDDHPPRAFREHKWSEQQSGADDGGEPHHEAPPCADEEEVDQGCYHHAKGEHELVHRNHRATVFLVADLAEVGGDNDACA